MNFTHSESTMKLRYSLLTAFVAVSTIACSGNSHVPSPLILTVSPQDDVAIHSTSTARETVTDIEWAQLAFDHKDRSKFDRSQLPKDILDLDGKLIRVRGYFNIIGILSARDIKKFVLLAEITSPPVNERKFFAEPSVLPLHYLMAVQMADGESAIFTSKPIEVVGRFSINVFEFDGKPYCVFRIHADSVKAAETRDGYHSAVCGGC